MAEVIDDDVPPGLTDVPPSASSRYDAQIGAAAKKYGVNPARIKAIIEQESRFNPNAFNEQTKATGLGQFIPATAKAYNIDPRDPQQSIDATAKMFRENLGRFGNDEDKATAAHFAGPDTGKWGPKTAQYQKDVRARMPVADEPPGLTDEPPGLTSAKPKPAAAKQTEASPLGDYSSAFVNPVAEAVGNMASGAVGKVSGDLAGLGAIAAHYLGLTDKLPMDVQRQVQEALTYQPRTPEGQKMARYNPLALVGQGLGAVADAAGRMVAKPDSPANPIGAGVAEAIKQAPMLLGGPAVKYTAPVLEAGAQRMMRSALKPPIGTPQAQRVATDTVNTLLDEGINVSRGGVQTMTDRVNNLNNNIATLIQNSPAVINRDLVASRLHDVVNKFAKQVNPLSDLKSIQGAWDEFTNTWQQQVPVALAQELKQGTYRNLSGKYQGELRSADIEAQKALARGLKEEIANAVPEVRVLNAEESKYLNALPLVERRVLHDANKNPIGLGIISTNPAHLAAWMADKSALFKSLVARMLNTGSNVAEAVAPAGGLAGAMSNEPQQRRSR